MTSRSTGRSGSRGKRRTLRRRIRRRLSHPRELRTPALIALAVAVVALAALAVVLPKLNLSDAVAQRPATSPTSPHASQVAESAAADAALATLEDTFDRSDRSILGDVAPTGHVYFEQNPDGARIEDRDLRFDLTPGETSIVYADMPSDVTAGSIDFQWLDELGHRSVVLGLCHTGFGSASVQVSVWPSVSTDVTVKKVDWAVFVVDGPRRYTVLASGVYDADFVPALDTTYTLGISRTGDRLVVNLPDGTSHEVADPAIGEDSGHRIGYQWREGHGHLGDVKFTRITATSEP